ncbi:MAG: hypothetical protein J0L97_10105 [Alphaproteobacteria bacterium]|nr:hypothetical protein [Alphaproteobacteria bacterium]
MRYLWLLPLLLVSCTSAEDARIEALCKGNPTCIDHQKMERYIQRNKAQAAAAGASSKSAPPVEEGEEDGAGIWGYQAPWRQDVWGRPY